MIGGKMHIYARTTDPQTSHKAAKQATREPKANEARLAVLHVFQALPHTALCDVEIYNAVQAGKYANRFSASRIRHARLELERARVLCRTGDKVIMDGAARQTFRLCEEHHTTALKTTKYRQVK